jgi:multiple antibiotic resistance protein
VTAGVLTGVLLLTLVALLMSRKIHKLLGSTGANVLVRVLGLILAALATEQIAIGLESLLHAA